MFFAFEPWTIEESVINDQLNFISVNVGENVQVNQSLGFLKPVTASEFSHIHWTIYESSFFKGQKPVSPYDYCNNVTQRIMLELCLSFGKIPKDPL